MDVDVSTVEDHLLCWKAFFGNSFDVLRVEIGDWEDSLSVQLLIYECYTGEMEVQWLNSLLIWMEDFPVII